MKRLILGSLPLLTALWVYSQDHQTVKKTLSRHLEEVYDVAKTAWKIKDGRYFVLDDAGNQVVQGTYSKGVKTGIWTYLNDAGTVVQRYDFSRDSLLYSATVPGLIVHTGYQILDPSGDSGKIQVPYKIGGPDYGFYLLYDERDIPAVVKTNADSVFMTVVITVSEKGVLESYTLLFAGEHFTDITVHKSVKGLPHDAYEFSAATVNGRPVRSQLSWVVPLNIDHIHYPGTNNIPEQKTRTN